MINVVPAEQLAGNLSNYRCILDYDIQVKERGTCNCVLIECKDELKIRMIYESYGFQILQNDNHLIQYYKII